MPATSYQTLFAEGACFNCYGELSEPQILELALLRRTLLVADPTAIVTPQGLMTYGACFACPGASEFEIMKLALLDQLSQTIALGGGGTGDMDVFTETLALVDGKTVADTSIFTVAAGKTYYLLTAQFIGLSVVGMSVPPQVNIRKTAGIGLSPLFTLTGIDDELYMTTLPFTTAGAANAGEDVYVTVVVAATATTCNLQVVLTGYYLP